MKIEKIKPTPKYILALIEKIDKSRNYKPCGQLRFYSYLTKNDGELVKVTCAVKVYKNKWYCKQVAVHGLHSDKCFVRDMEYSYMGGYKVGFFYEGMRSTNAPRWFEDNKWYPADDKYYNPFSSIVNPEYAYKLPTFKYSACDLFRGGDIIEYLRTYEKYPQAEYLVKLGLLSSYVLSKQILEKVGKDKAFRKFIGRNRDILSSDILYISAILSAYKQGKSIKEMHRIEACRKELIARVYKPVRDLVKTEYDRYFAYLEKQNINNTLYADYLRACQYLNVDMSKDKNRYPHNFMHEHDIRIDDMRREIAIKNEQDRKKREEEDKHLIENFIAVARKFMPLQSIDNGAYCIYIAQTPSELVREGEALHHCVGKLGYDKKQAREQSLIFFVRSATDTETPLATIEFDIKRNKILQFYADHNSTPSADVTEYVNNVWLPSAQKALKKIAA